MPELVPFRAVLPATGKAGLVSSRSYETYGRDELLAVLSQNPYSFLHIINAGYQAGPPLSPSQRFRLVAGKYHEFIKRGILIKDTAPSFYLYEFNTPGHRFLGLFCATNTRDYRAGLIRRHEETIAGREAIFADYLEVVKFNAEPVLLMYPDRPAIRKKLEQEGAKQPIYEFYCERDVRHRLWTINSAETIHWLQAEFSKIEAFYIADGHHRCASSSLLAQRSAILNPGIKGNEPINYFMSCLLPESEIRIGSYTRLVKDLNGLSLEVFHALLAKSFRIVALGGKAPKNIMENQFLMYLAGSFYSLRLKPGVTEFQNALDRLDAQILYSKLLNPILDIRDLRNEKRIRYGYGDEKMSLMKAKIDRGEFRIGFAMKPVSTAELKAIADSGLAMPPKSTYIEPKMRSGMAIYEL